jgi:hypothetical protein
MTFSEYELWFRNLYNHFSLEAGAQELGPFLRRTAGPAEHHWKVDWVILFADGMHLRLKETYSPRALARGGGGERKHFSYHYGNTPASVGPDGFPEPKLSTPTIRLDHDRFGPHAHFNGQDHLKQDRIQGLQLGSAEMFVFLDAIVEHRKTQRPIDKLLGFTLV